MRLVPPEILGSTRTFRSIPVIIGLLMIPLFFASVVGFYALSTLENLGLATGFAVGLIDTLKNTIQVFDAIILLVFGVSFAGVIIRSFRVNTPMVFAALGLLFLPVVVFGSALISNAVGVFSNLPLLSGAASNFPLSLTFFQNTGLIAAGAGVLVILVMVGGGLARGR